MKTESFNALQQLTCFEKVKQKILKDYGRIAHKKPLDKANSEYVLVNLTLRIESDFVRAVKKREENGQWDKWKQPVEDLFGAEQIITMKKGCIM